MIAGLVEDLTSVFQALVIGSVTDSVRGGSPAVFAVRLDRRDIYVKTVEGGLFCLAGDPALVLGDLSVSHSVSLHVSAPGYREIAATAAIPANAALPVSIALQLRPLPVRIQGRVVTGTKRSPVNEAVVRSVDDPAAPPPPAPPATTEHVVALRTWLRSAYPAGSNVNEEDLPTAGTTKTLSADVSSGAQSVRLSNRTGLAVGGLLRFGSAPDHEYVAVSGPTPIVNPSAPGDITLAVPLDRGFAAGSEVRRVTINATGVVRHLSRAAEPGDGVVFLDGTQASPAIQVVHPVGGKNEHHEVGAATDADGYYRLDAIGGVATLFFDARKSGGPALATPLEYRVDYANAINVVDFRL